MAIFGVACVTMTPIERLRSELAQATYYADYHRRHLERGRKCRACARRLRDMEAKIEQYGQALAALERL